MPTYSEMESQANNISDIYRKLQDEIVSMFIDKLNEKGIDDANIFKWQVDKLSHMHLITQEIIDKVSEQTGIVDDELEKLIIDNGHALNEDMRDELSQYGLDSEGLSNIDIILEELRYNAKNGMDNYVNAGLLDKNSNSNAFSNAYKNIVNQTTAEVSSGLKTFDQSFRDAIYKLTSDGMMSDFKDKAGRNWHQDVYVRSLMQNTVHQVYHDARMDAMDEFGNELCVISQHVASREACAYIQGHVVDMTPDHKHKKYPSVWSYGYKEPAGTAGINCRHIYYPFIEGVSENNQDLGIKPEDAIKNGEIQQKQRLLERKVRDSKRLLAKAEELKDDAGILKYKMQIKKYQSGLRKLVNDNKFLNRDYTREKVFSSTDKRKIKAKSKPIKPIKPKKAELKHINKNLQSHIGDKSSKDIESRLSKAPKDIRNVWNKYKDNFKISNYNNDKGTDSYYLPSTKEVSFKKDDVLAQGKAKWRKKYDTFYHEFGHAIDDFAGDISKSRKFNLSSKIQSDYMKLMNKYIEKATNEGKSYLKTSDHPLLAGKYFLDGKEVKLTKSGKLPIATARKIAEIMFRHDFNGKNMSVYGDFSDMISAQTKDKINFGVHHKSSYWSKQQNGDAIEFFAETTSAYINNPESLEVIKKYFPEAFETYLEMLKEILED